MLKIDLHVGRRAISILEKIMKRIAENPGINAYQIARISPRLDRVTVMRTIRRYRIVEQNLVRVEKGKRNAICYFVTLEGILYVLYKELLPAEMKTRDQAFILKIIRQYRSMLPLVFGKWDYFDKMEARRMALCRLKAVVDSRDKLLPGHSWIPGRSMEEKICWFFYFAGLFTFPQNPALFEDWCGMEDLPKWMNVLVQDTDVKAFAVNAIETYQRALKSYSAFVERHVTWIIGATEPEKNVEEGGKS